MVDQRCYVAIAARAIEVLEKAYDHLRRTSYTEDPVGRRRAGINEAVGLMAGAGICQLKAARHDMDGGWEGESIIHVRAALEATFDIAFLLKHTGKERGALARQYIAMTRLRLPSIRKGMEEDPGRYPVDKREEWELLEREFGESKGTNPRGHWTGMDRGRVREMAFKYLEETMPEQIGDLTSIVKGMVYDQLCSPVVHADPAGTLFLPKDEKGWLLIEEQPAKWVHGMPLCLASLMLLWSVAQRASGHKDEAERLLHEAHRLVEKDER
jgi:hypothetical protein